MNSSAPQVRSYRGLEEQPLDGIKDARATQVTAEAVSIRANGIPISEPGDYTLDLYAYDPANGNTGLVKFNLTAR